MAGDNYGYLEGEYTRADTLTKKQRAERRLLIATIIIAMLIIMAFSFIIIVLFILDPIQVADVMESHGLVDVAGILREAAEVLESLRH